MVQTLKHQLKKIPAREWQVGLANILLALRSTPGATTGKSPAELLMGRRLRTLLDKFHPETSQNFEEKGEEKPWLQNRKLSVSDDVLYRNFGRGPKWESGKIEEINGSRNFTIKTPDGDQKKRHLDQIIRKPVAATTVESIPESTVRSPSHLNIQTRNTPSVSELANSSKEGLLEEDHQAGTPQQAHAEAWGTAVEDENPSEITESSWKGLRKADTRTSPFGPYPLDSIGVQISSVRFPKDNSGCCEWFIVTADFGGFREQHLREVLIFCFNWKKSAAEAHRMLVEVYGDTAATDKSCREWFRRFKDGDFSVEDKPRSRQPKKFEDKELEALLEEDQSQTQEELAGSLGVTQQAVSVRLRAMGMIQKQGNWVPYELKPRDVERRFFTCELLIQRQQRKGFLHRIVTGDEKWIFYDNPKRKKYYAKPGQSLPSTSNQHQSRTFMVRRSCSVSGGTKRVLFTMSC
nr:PREDICTED: uncharacterized protein LOC105669663 [Linepithema humile]